MRWFVGIALSVWAGACLVGGGLLLLHHLASLPTPTKTDPGLRDAVAAAFPDRPAGWRAVHVMYRTCLCSRRTIDHLRARLRPAALDELVVMVDDAGRAGPEDLALRAAGFRVEVITPAALHTRFHVDAAPLFVIARPDHEVAYVGGYSRHKQSAIYEDLAILDDVRRRDGRAALPVFGCATSARLADTIDPLGLRRW